MITEKLTPEDLAKVNEIQRIMSSRLNGTISTRYDMFKGVIQKFREYFRGDRPDLGITVNEIVQATRLVEEIMEGLEEIKEWYTVTKKLTGNEQLIY